MARIQVGGHTMGLRDFERTMIFIDGTNFFCRLREQRLKMPSLTRFLNIIRSNRPLIRTYVYSTKKRIEEAQREHGENFLDGCRIIHGDSVSTKSGYKEKGVDALLVADLIYHAASNNCNYAILVSHDSDFRHALKRVEDFGCRTALCAVAVHAPDRLRDECDDYLYFSKDQMKQCGAIDIESNETT